MKSSSSQAESETQTGQIDPVVQFLEDAGVPVTLENYIAVNFDDALSYEELGAEQKTQIPDFLRPKKGSV
jgi:hypothetical protein